MQTVLCCQASQRVSQQLMFTWALGRQGMHSIYALASPSPNCQEISLMNRRNTQNISFVHNDASSHTDEGLFKRFESQAITVSPCVH